MQRSKKTIKQKAKYNIKSHNIPSSMGEINSGYKPINKKSSLGISYKVTKNKIDKLENDKKISSKKKGVLYENEGRKNRYKVTRRLQEVVKGLGMNVKPNNKSKKF